VVGVRCRRQDSGRGLIDRPAHGPSPDLHRGDASRQGSDGPSATLVAGSPGRSRRFLRRPDLDLLLLPRLASPSHRRSLSPSPEDTIRYGRRCRSCPRPPAGRPARPPPRQGRLAERRRLRHRPLARARACSLRVSPRGALRSSAADLGRRWEVKGANIRSTVALTSTVPSEQRSGASLSSAI
jgi:hypothetical protein